MGNASQSERRRERLTWTAVCLSAALTCHSLPDACLALDLCVVSLRHDNLCITYSRLMFAASAARGLFRSAAATSGPSLRSSLLTTAPKVCFSPRDVSLHIAMPHLTRLPAQASFSSDSDLQGTQTLENLKVIFFFFLFLVSVCGF